jgi:trk system potassium uptake protein TrkA
MQIVIVGAGEVGHHLAHILSSEAHKVSVVDRDAARVKRVAEALDVQAVVGDGTQAEVLNSCGTSKADLLIAVTQNDHVNMLCCALGRELGAKRRILRLKDTAILKGYRYFYKRTLGFDVVLSTEELAAQEILNTVREQHALEVESFADGRVQMRRLRLQEESEITLRPLANLVLPPGVVIGAVVSKERFFVPRGEDQLKVEDQLYVFGRSSELDLFERLAGHVAQQRRSVVVMGAAGIGRALAHELGEEGEISLRVIEKDPERARALVSEVPASVVVLVGDATDLDLLLEERIGDANIFIATSEEDERNMVACQLARSLGVQRTIALVNKASYRQIYDLLGIDRAIAPRVLCANRILRFVRSSSISAVSVIGEGRAEVLELEARFKDRESRKVKSLGLPQGTVIGALVRGEAVIIPRGDTLVQEGDHVILLALPENLDELESMFRRIEAVRAD